MGLSVLLAFSCAAVLSGVALADGTVLELHNQRYLTGAPLWVVPDPTASSSGAPLGCQNLPDGYSPASGRIYWNATNGRGVCQYIWFFFGRDCQGGARGVQIVPRPANLSIPWATQDADYSRTTYHKVEDGKSIGCSFNPDPCEQYPCEDPHAQCTSSSGWSFADSQGKAWASQVRNCSTCKPGYSLLGGKCQNEQELCAALQCPAPATCVVSMPAGASCQCPAGSTWNDATQQCAQEPSKVWVQALNQVRKEGQAAQRNQFGGKSMAASSAPLVWNNQLAEVATNWTLYLNSTQCGQPTVVLTKLPDSNCSESDVWVSWSADESAAVQLWAPSPSDNTNPRTARITDPTTRFTGCGTTKCGAGAFFTCLFWPKTF